MLCGWALRKRADEEKLFEIDLLLAENLWDDPYGDDLAGTLSSAIDQGERLSIDNALLAKLRKVHDAVDPGDDI